MLGRSALHRFEACQLPGPGRQCEYGRGALRPRRHHLVAHGECHEGAHLGRRTQRARQRLSCHDPRRDGRRTRPGGARRRGRPHPVAAAHRPGTVLHRRRAPRRPRHPDHGRLGRRPGQPTDHLARAGFLLLLWPRLGRRLGPHRTRPRLHARDHRTHGRRRP